jgi:hypothetical protein
MDLLTPDRSHQQLAKWEEYVVSKFHRLSFSFNDQPLDRAACFACALFLAAATSHYYNMDSIAVLPYPMTVPLHDIDTVSVSSVESCCPSSPVALNRKRSRRTVRFEEGDDRQVKRRVVRVESVLNLADKSDLWVQPEEVTETMRSVRQENQAFRVDSAAFEAYVDALADAYCVCCSEDNTGSAKVVSPAHVALLGLARGTEPCSLPELAVARGERRRNGIQSVVQLDALLRNDSQRDVLLAAVAENLSCSAKRFAQVLGVADATASLLEHWETFSIPQSPRILLPMKTTAPAG